MNLAVREAGCDVEIWAPYAFKRKWEIMRLAQEHGVKPHETWFCSSWGRSPLWELPCMSKAREGNASMMLMCGQSNRIWHYWAGRYPGSVGLLVGPSYLSKVPIDPWMPFALDNDAFSCWLDGRPWDECAWERMLDLVMQRRQRPLWVVIPDVVGDRLRTIERYHRYVRRVIDRGFTAAIAVQDGMSPDDIPDTATVIFIGGTDDWKLQSVPMWCEHFEAGPLCSRESPESDRSM